MNFVKHIYILFLLFARCNFIVADNPSKAQVKAIMEYVENDFSVYCVVKVFDISKQKEYQIATTTDLLYHYFYNKDDIKKKESRYFGEIKSVLKGKSIQVKDSVVFYNTFNDYIIDKTDYMEFKQKDLKETLKEYFDSNYIVSKTRNKKKFNAVVKILYERNVLIFQEDISGLYRINPAPLHCVP
jgi:hypothetical protein